MNIDVDDLIASCFRTNLKHESIFCFLQLLTNDNASATVIVGTLHTLYLVG